MKARDTLYHAEGCFTCFSCAADLREVAVYCKEGQLYCESDYKKNFVPLCAKCLEYILEVSALSPLDETLTRSQPSVNKACSSSAWTQPNRLTDSRTAQIMSPTKVASDIPRSSSGFLFQNPRCIRKILCEITCNQDHVTCCALVLIYLVHHNCPELAVRGRLPHGGRVDGRPRLCLAPQTVACPTYHKVVDEGV